jgi:hypothetical protein
MKLSDNLGMILLSIWLIASGALTLFNVNFPASDTILAVLAVAAGLLILLGGKRGRLRLSKNLNLGMLLLSIWLIVTGAITLFNVSFPASGTILAILAMATGLLLLLKRN